MACTVVICEPLCFLSNNFDKLTISQLKPIVANFHQDEEVIEAKEILLKDVSRAAQDDGGSDLPRLPRRQGDNKGRQSVDDLLKLFTTVDERKLTGALPRYVAENLTRVPFVNADSVNVLTMAKNTEGLEQRMKAVEQLLLQSTLHLESDECTDDAESVDAGTAMNDATLEDDQHEVWSTVLSKKKHKQTVEDGGKPPEWSCVVRMEKQPLSSPPSRQTVHKQPTKQKILGTRKSSEVLKPGVPIVKKSVVHIDNLDPDCSEALLKDYILSDDISVLSCYKAQCWLRQDEKDKVTAFQVFVPLAQREKLFDPQLWSEGVVIRDWKFKKTNIATDGRS